MAELGWSVRDVADHIESGDKLRNRALLATFMRRDGKLGGLWCDKLEQALGLPFATLSRLEAEREEVERARVALKRGRKR